jgi:ribose transport system ATP-binding protein
MEAIFGVHGFTRGVMRVDGQEVRFATARAAVRAGLALVSEDRKAQGLALGQSVLDNTLLVVRSVFARGAGAQRRRVPGILSSLDVVARSADQEVRFLSGGNQQKVVLAKWLLTEPHIVLFDEPTRGIDVGAKVAVYELMRELAARGKAVLMVSSELPEVIGMSDRILVMRDGRLVAQLPAGSAEHEVLAAATGGTSQPDGTAATGGTSQPDGPAATGGTSQPDGPAATGGTSQPDGTAATGGTS